MSLLCRCCRDCLRRPRPKLHATLSWLATQLSRLQLLRARALVSHCKHKAENSRTQADVAWGSAAFRWVVAAGRSPQLRLIHHDCVLRSALELKLQLGQDTGQLRHLWGTKLTRWLRAVLPLQSGGAARGGPPSRVAQVVGRVFWVQQA